MTFEELGIRTKPGKRRYSTTCPKCSKDRKKKTQPCLTVNDEPGNRWWHCNHCDWGGNLDLQGKFDEVQKKSRMPEGKVEAYSQVFTKYLREERGFNVRTLTKEKIFEYKTGKQTIIGFPYFIGLTLVNVKYYKLGAKDNKWFQMPRDLGTKSCFWGFGDHTFKLTPNDEKDGKPNVVIITEGEWDRLTWKECGYANVLSVPQGAPTSKSRDFKKEFEYANESYFRHLAKSIDLFYLAVDEDEPGEKLRDQLAIILGKEKCRIIRYPIGYKDINEVLVGNKEKKLEALGKDGVIECFQNVESYPLKGLMKPSLVRSKLNDIRDKGFTPGLGIGIPEINYLFTIKPKHISFWTGVPSAGKSVFIRWYITELIRHNSDMNLKFAMFTPENRPVEREYAKIAQVLTGQSIRKSDHNAMSDETFRKTMNFVEKHFHVIAPDRYNYETFDGKIKASQINTLESLLKYVRYLVKTEGIFGYVIDAWNKVDYEIPRNYSEHNFISKQLDLLIDFNEYYNVHGFIIAHPTKLRKNTIGNYDMPSMYDVKGTSAWNEKADLGIVIHRNKFRGINEGEKRGSEDDREYIVRDEAPLIIKSEKIRFEELGNNDIVRVVMNKSGGFEIFEDDKDIHKRKDKVKLAGESEPEPPPLPEGLEFDEDDDLPF